MKTAVVILNWNTREYLERWLPALLSSCKGNDAQVIVADSASSDGSLEMMSTRFPDVRTIPLGSNYGFTGGYNRALEQVNAEYFVLMNSDIRVEPGWLEPLVDWMDSHPGCGVCGPKLHRMDSDEFEYAGAAGGYIDRFGYPYCRGRVLKRTESDCGQYNNPHNVLWISGACLMTRSSLWKSLGGLDDRFFAHMEEIDYCWRAQLDGWKVTVVPDSCVSHLGGGTLPQESPLKLKLNYRNNLLMLQNNLAATIGCRKASVRIFTRKLFDGCSAVVYLLQGRKACFKAVLDAHREASALRQRKAQRRSGNAAIDGYSEICIILQSLLRGKAVFTYLRKYEDNH